MSQLDRILAVASGDKPLAVGMEPQAVLSIGLAVFLAMLLALIISNRIN